MPHNLTFNLGLQRTLSLSDVPASMASKGKKAVVLKGKEIAGEIRAQVAAEIAQLKEKTPSFQPLLTIVQVCVCVVKVISGCRLKFDYTLIG